ncbi:MAG: HlyC/CorC family transporter [Gammaproteobacteria bacterium]|nr:HlyC/CorC family transporter [Gammaproteobacteria bacterium]
MADISLSVLMSALLFLVLLSAFFSAAEIGLMTLNRYRLHTLANSGHRGARIARKLLERPDRLLGVILLGNNFANIAASSIVTLIAIEFYGESAIAAAAGLLTFIILVFSEVAPKTLAALYPERIAFPSAYILLPLLWLIYPLVWLVNAIANRTLRLFGVKLHNKPATEVTADELRVLVREADVLIPASHQDMLLAILDLEKITVNDVMVPRGKIEGVDLDAEWEDIINQITGSRYTRLPTYRGSLDNVTGIIHVRRVLNLMRKGTLDRESFEQAIIEPYFIPSGTTLTTQLINFRQVKRRIGMVVDEYGDIQGLVALDEILEEIVGDFSSHAVGKIEDVQQQADGSYLVRGTVSLRDLNRQLAWDLPTDESRTLNGLIVEYLEDIPEPGTSLMVHGYQVEILRTRGTAIDIARVRPTPDVPEEKDTLPPA